MNKKVGEKIRQIRAIKGLSQDNVADEISMSAGNYGKIERGEIDVSSTHLIEIAKVLKVSVSEFFDEKTKTSSKDNKADYGFATKEDAINLMHMVQSLAKEIEKLREELTKKKHSLKKKNSKK